MRSYLISFFLLFSLFNLLPAQNFDIEIYDVQVPDSADANLELQVDAKIINHGPTSWTINTNESIMRYALLDSVPDSLDYSSLPVDDEDFNQGTSILLSPGDTLDYSYRLDVSGKGGGKGITVVIWPTRAASLLDSNLPNGFFIATSRTPNSFNATKGLSNKGKGNNMANNKGSSTKSKKITRTATQRPLNVYPNPAFKSLNILMPLPYGDLTLLDMQGRVVYQQNTLASDQLSLSLTSLNLSPGLYLIRWQNGDMIETDKVWIISR